ncbi:Myb-like DNA-binding domain [Musa troglodytarum]|uniref:Myb-like DNA-binding domain n=1 Tax=Musa troglodytarum TaxID=320322 RepID=A0A9E7KSQ0_9LILI|nr:Myb-like DNA-binding domain [Musa troglodytarum]
MCRTRMVMVKEEMRRGPWTEQEDLQLAWFAALFGERRWDFIAKVSGLNRTGKSCRMRWVNYLHPSLKRGRMTPQEECLILELHSRWGNRWSRIARKLPGRTDNEIKNYWRTHMRKKAQEQKRSFSPSRTTTSLADDFPIGSEPRVEAAAGCQLNSSCMSLGLDEDNHGADWCSMAQAWNEMAMPEAIDGPSSEDCKEITAWPPPLPSPPMWECCAAPLWKTDEEAELNGAAFGF